MTIDILNKHFKYYLENERVFLETERFVAFDSTCKKAYSYVYSNLLMSICSDFESLYRSFYEIDENAEISISKVVSDIENDERLNGMLLENASLRGTDYIGFQPLKVVTDQNSKIKYFDWWHYNNAIKHNKINKISRANQEMIIHALCGLYVFNVYILRAIKEQNGGVDIFLNDNEIFQLERLKPLSKSPKQAVIMTYEEVCDELEKD